MSHSRLAVAVPPPRPPRRRFRLAVVGLTVSCALAACAVWQLRHGAERFLTMRLRSDLAAEPPERAPDLLRSALELGEPGQALLVESLSAPQSSTADAALYLLLDQIERWQTGEVADGPRRFGSLADALAEACPQLDTAGRQRAGRLARQILLSTPALGAASGAVVADCELVLRSTMFASAMRSEPARHPRTLKSPDAGEPTFSATHSAIDSGTRLGHSLGAEAAGAGLDYEPYRPELPEYASGRAERASPQTPQKAAAPMRSLTWSSETSAAKAPAARAAAPMLTEAPQLRSTPSAANHQSDALSAASDPTSTIDWMRRLHGDAAAERTARRELASRGFGQLEIELARRLTDDDPEVRRQLAEWLPRLPNIDARPWLLWLSEDSSPRVRMLAATLMSTSSDPALLERVTAMYRGDSDPDVRKRAAQRQPDGGR